MTSSVSNTLILLIIYSIYRTVCYNNNNITYSNDLYDNIGEILLIGV